MRRRVPASLVQQGIWFTEQVGGAGSAYHMPLTIRLEGDVDVRALVDACAAVVSRHQVLGGAFEEHGGVPCLVDATARPAVTHVNLAGSPAGEVERRLAELVRRETLRPFDLRRGPLVRFTLCALGGSRFELVVVVHHLAFDGQSKDVLVRDLAALYGSLARGSAAELQSLPSYADQVANEQRRVAGALATAEELWARRWRGPDGVVLPGLARSDVGVEGGESCDLALHQGTSAALDAASEALGASRFELLLTALHALLHRYGNGEATVAIDISTRTPLTRDCVGAFVNELPVTSRHSSGQTFADLLRATRAELRELYPLRDVPLARTVSGIKPRVALAPVSLSYRRRTGEPGFAGLSTSVDWMLFNLAARNALHLQVVDGPGSLAASLQYSPRALDPAAADRIASHFVTLLRAGLAQPDARVTDLPLLSEDERERLLVGGPAPEQDRGATVVELFAAQATRTPDAVAVDGLTYAELDAAARRLAGRLRAEGLRPGDVVAIGGERSPELVAGLLGVLLAGAAYLPLDPAHPPARLAAIAADAGARLLLTQERLRPRFADVPARVVPLDGGASPPFAWEPRPADLAYVISTSGSTGRPKCVEVEHGALANLLRAMGRLLGAGPGDAWLAVTSPSFDISALELLLPLATGGRVVLAGDGLVRDGAGLVRLVRDRGVTHVQATPSLWRLLLEAGFDEPGVVALCGGETLPAALARELRPRVARLLNVYGPTESTIWSTAWEVPVEAAAVSIGAPVDRTRVYVLDERLDLVPAGLEGELCIGGAGVARGYRGRPDLTAERFVADPFGPPGARLYRTGDHVRWRSDGVLEFLGRADGQVKVRGHRVELGEIEAALLDHPSVGQAAVVLREDGPGEPGLVAYLVPRTPEGQPDLPDAADVRAHLARTLPDAMLPSAIVTLDRLPLTVSGKLDRAALPEPPRRRVEPVQPAAWSGLARDVRDICCEVMKLDDIQPDESLFDLGGHSLTMTMIASRIRKRLRRELPLHVFYDEPTIAGIVQALGEG
ncbi:MAG TPA: amino acid adenylation domain-containing protein [Candidatus Dormibacteraeota bacterium]|nr:amino acid adenylation domain-containing protein [Candidatus Dormibacteraeota bacterium]